MQQTIAEHLGLDLSTVANFFMNARRRSRNGPHNSSDEPAPFQKVCRQRPTVLHMEFIQVRPITPPPQSPPQPLRPAKGRPPRVPIHLPPSTDNHPSVDSTIDQVAAAVVQIPPSSVVSKVVPIPAGLKAKQMAASRLEAEVGCARTIW